MAVTDRTSVRGDIGHGVGQARLPALLALSVVIATVLAGVTTARAQPATSPSTPASDTSPTDPAATPSPTTAETTSPTPAVDDPPTVRMARGTWDTGWFQAEIHRQLLMRIGYQVEGPTTMENAEFFSAVADGDVDLWANGWFPLHGELLEDGSERVGTQVDAGALTGYFVDLRTAEEHGITNLADLADPQLAGLFDVDGNGRADLYGCNEAWACGPLVDHHLEAFGLTDTVEQIQADYSPLMVDTVDRHDQGESVLFYGFTPHWILGELVPGEDVRWLQTPGRALPGRDDLDDAPGLVAGLDGCVDDPCQTGFEPNDIQSVANSAFLDEHPDIRSLLEQVTIPLSDILDQNALMVQGHSGSADIRAQASQWLADHEAEVTEWVARAAPDAVPVTDDGTQALGATGPPLQVAVRTLEPFVLYEQRTYSGFSVELLDAVGARLGRDVEFYGVDSIAKQLDDVDRGVADMAVSGIAITSEREATTDFSLPVFQTGLGIMVPNETQGGLLGQARALGRTLISSNLPWLILAFVLILLFSAHAIWWLERRNNPDFPAVYRTGIWDSFWWATVTITTVGYGDKTPTGRGGRGWALLWMIAGYFVFASFTASMTSSLAVNELRGSINGPNDLREHRVTTVAGSAAQDWLLGEGIAADTRPVVEDAYDVLAEGGADAVVFDAPVLQYHVLRDGAGEVRVVGPSFDTVRYGIAISDDDTHLREQVNLALLQLIESGEYDRLRDKWFGEIED